MGWRLVAGLTARAVVTFGVLFIPARPRAGRGAPGLGGERPSDRASALGGLRPGRPTAARGPRARGHGRADSHPLGGVRASVDLIGEATGSGIRPTVFGCHAIRLGIWQVERLIFTER